MYLFWASASLPAISRRAAASTSGQRPATALASSSGKRPDYDLADWVLGKFQGEDKKVMDEAVKRAADAVECILKEGADRAMNRFN